MQQLHWGIKRHVSAPETGSVKQVRHRVGHSTHQLCMCATQVVHSGTPVIAGKETSHSCGDYVSHDACVRCRWTPVDTMCPTVHVCGVDGACRDAQPGSQETHGHLLMPCVPLCMCAMLNQAANTMMVTR